MSEVNQETTQQVVQEAEVKVQPKVFYSEIVENGLWKQNPGLVQLLGLCPTLAMTVSLVNGFSLGVMTAVVMAASNASVAPIRQWVPTEIRIPVFILIIAALVTIIDLSMHAYLQSLHAVLGIFIPLIVTNCIVLARVEAVGLAGCVLRQRHGGGLVGVGVELRAGQAQRVEQGLVELGHGQRGRIQRKAQLVVQQQRCVGLGGI